MKTAAGFFWKSGWAFVPKRRLTERMSKAEAHSVAHATAFAAISNSCALADHIIDRCIPGCTFLDDLAADNPGKALVFLQNAALEHDGRRAFFKPPQPSRSSKSG